MRGIFKGKLKKTTLILVALFFILSNFYFLALYDVKTTKATIPVADAPVAALNIGWTGFEVYKYSAEEIINDLKATFFKNVVANLARQFAKGTAQWIVTGSKGGKPFWETDMWGNIVDQAQGAFEDWLVGAIATGTGIDVCNFDPSLTLNIALTLPNKPDKLQIEPGILGEATPSGCSFQDLKDKFSMEGKEWQDFVKLKTTDIGPDYGKTIEQLDRDIKQNKNLKLNNAEAPNFNDNVRVLSDLQQHTARLKTMNNELNNDIDELMAKKGTNEAASLSVGTFPVNEVYINDIKNAWQQKLSPGKSEANSKKSLFNSCANKDLTAMVLDPCASVLADLGYSGPPGANWINNNPQKAQQWVREVQGKLKTAYNLYNSVATAYDSMHKFVSNQIKPEMFTGAGLFTLEKSYKQFQPQADIPGETQTQLDTGGKTAEEKKKEEEKTKASVNEGWKNLEEKIAGGALTPQALLKAKNIESLSKEDSVGDYTKSIIADSLGVFLEELYNLYINQLLQSLSNPKKQKEKKKKISLFSSEEQSIVTEEGVNLYYESLSQGFNYEKPDVDLLQEFQTTISGTKINPNIYNNVIDLNFALAINQRISIKKAITDRKLNGEAGFSWSETLKPNTYNLSNLRKLRKARVVPLGLELAAELIRDCNYRNIFDSDSNGTPDFNNFQDLNSEPNAGGSNAVLPYDNQRLRNCLFLPGVGNIEANKSLKNQVINATLNDVVNGFNQRGLDGACGNYDTGESPFCNLVDPDWVLKIPATKCLQTESTEAYGEVLRDNASGSRYGRCVDFVSCLKDDTLKSCGSSPTTSQYGVCVKEKNVWRLGGDTCPAQYDSCRNYTMTDNEGKESDVAFLKNTLDPSGCGPDTVGCKGYTRVYDRNKFYFNKNVQTCDDTAEGCHEFIADPTILTNFPTLPTVYDDNVLASRVYYKINPYCDLNPDAEGCSNFMAKCTDAEVGCAEYKPVSGDPTVTAVLQPEDDLCPAECNGFSAFFRQPTFFDPVADLTYFVPPSKNTCSADAVGCSEFTNLVKSGETGAEKREQFTGLRYCVEIGTGKGEKLFYTWQSISSGPQQIFEHVLLANADGSPKTIDNSGDCQADPNVAGYCLSFYSAKPTASSSPSVYYRDIRKTVIAAGEECRPLRKTVSSQAVCESTLGEWKQATVDGIDNYYCFYNAYVAKGSEEKNVYGSSQRCSSNQVNCYNYLGAGGRNIYNLFYDDFEADTFPAEYSTGGVAISNESLSATGHSLEVEAGASAVRSVSITANSYYVLVFWAKAETGKSGLVKVNGFGDVNVTDQWFAQSIGPITLDTDINSLVFDNLTGAKIYLDNVNIVRHTANYYLIKDSWAQVGCEIADLNCQEYKGPNSQTFYIKQFSNLCDPDKVGCQYLLDTQNSTNPQIQDFKGLIVPADNKVSYVVKSDLKCNSEAKGCEKFNEPVLQSGTGLVYNQVILKNDPDAYTGPRSILCSAEAEGCTELINSNGYPEYYKIDPTKVCQYTHNYINNLKEDMWGWYLTGTPSVIGCNTIDYNNQVGCAASGGNWDSVTEICDTALNPTSACASNNGIWLTDYEQCAIPLALGTLTVENCTAAKGIWTSAGQCVNNPLGIFNVKESKYRGFTGDCPLDFGDCTGFETINQDKVTYGQIYYKMDNGNIIDRSSCSNVGTDWNSGCVTFRNTVSGDVQTIKVQKDRDCDEWVDCVEKDNVGNCLKMVSSYATLSGDPAFLPGKTTVSSNYCQTQTAAECDTVQSAGGQAFCQITAVGGKNICVSTGTNYIIETAAPMDKVRYSTAKVPLIINRKTYIERFAGSDGKDSDILRWENGDYSGYTIPDRYPLEMELAEGKRFATYAKEVASSKDDPRFVLPVCKVFPSDDSPISAEITGKFGYSKIKNLYSQSVNLDDIADSCNYDQAESTGVTTYFPFGYLARTFLEDAPRICTGITALNGKICHNAPDNAKNPECKTSSEEVAGSTANAYGKCDGIETLKTNFGLQGRCLEMDILNPLYGNIKPGSYACLSYFPFQYDECAAAKTVEECTKFPYCTWLNDKCVGDICDFYKSKDDCEKDETMLRGAPTKTCIWDGMNQKCLFRRCTITGATSASACTALATYCQYYGGVCMEDLCRPPYAALDGGMSNNKFPQNQQCGNPESAQYDAQGWTVSGNGDYCKMMTAMGGGGKYMNWWCMLKCNLKYPGNDTDSIKACNDDPFCQRTPESCINACAIHTNAEQCNFTEKCGWTSSGCGDKCKTYTTPEACNSTQDLIDCSLKQTCIDDGNPCSNLTEASVPPCSETKDPTDSNKAMCVWNGSSCNKAADYICANQSVANCNNTIYCKIKNECFNSDLESAPGVPIVGGTYSCAGTIETDCKVAPKSKYCAWGGGLCKEERDTFGCEKHIRAGDCNDDANCLWTGYVYKAWFNIVGQWCQPRAWWVNGGGYLAPLPGWRNP